MTPPGTVPVQKGDGPKDLRHRLAPPAALAGEDSAVGHPDGWSSQQTPAGALWHPPAMARCWLQGEERLPAGCCLPSPCSFTFTCPCLLLPPPQSMCPHLAPKITPRKRTTVPERHWRPEAPVDAPSAWGRRCSQISWINQTDTTLSRRHQAIGARLSNHSSASPSCDAPAPLPKAPALSPAWDAPTGDVLP